MTSFLKVVVFLRSLSLILFTVAVILIALVAVILLFVLKRNNGMGTNWAKSKQGNLNSSEKDCCDSLDYRGLDAHFTNGGDSLPIVQTHTNSLVPPSHPIYNPFSSHKTVSLLLNGCLKWC